MIFDHLYILEITFRNPWLYNYSEEVVRTVHGIRTSSQSLLKHHRRSLVIHLLVQ